MKRIKLAIGALAIFGAVLLNIRHAREGYGLVKKGLMGQALADVTDAGTTGCGTNEAGIILSCDMVEKKILEAQDCKYVYLTFIRVDTVFSYIGGKKVIKTKPLNVLDVRGSEYAMNIFTPPHDLKYNYIEKRINVTPFVSQKTTCEAGGKDPCKAYTPTCSDFFASTVPGPFE